MTKSESIDPVVAGSGFGNLTYVITLTNNGPSPATNITVTEQLTLPAGVMGESATPSAGANATVDRATYGSTVVGEGSKLDNLVMVAHNCRIGRHNILCPQVGIAGSTVTGDYVIMAGQVGIRDHVDIGDRVRIGAKAGSCTS